MLSFNLKKYCLPLAFLFVSCLLNAQDVSPANETSNNSESRGNFDWKKMSISSKISVTPDKKKIRPPAGRTQAEELLMVKYMDTIREIILSIPVDSSTVLRDFVNSGEIAPSVIDDLAFSAKRVHPYYSQDMQTISSSFTIDLNDVVVILMLSNAIEEMRRPLNAVSSPNYTGIIIIASDPLPSHGKHTNDLLVPSLFPKIWDTNMNIVFDKNMTSASENGTGSFIHWASPDDIFRKTPSGIDPELEEIVGPNPLRIIASGVFGIRPTDPIIDSGDALLILSTESNKDLLRKGKVAIIASESVLHSQ
jgi:hypothetical protein